MTNDSKAIAENDNKTNSSCAAPAQRPYESPKIECLGKLSSLIQGSTGKMADFAPEDSAITMPEG